MAVVKLGASRQIVIPKKFHDKLGLSPGTYLEVELRNNQLIVTPKELVDRRLNEGLEDIKNGIVLGPFNTADEAMQTLQVKKS
ncbi:MAG: AbrB/MazE/SpoVT family DNA-binding domain-containing protein [Candidatus Eremiobacterota bacterium]